MVAQPAVASIAVPIIKLFMLNMDFPVIGLMLIPLGSLACGTCRRLYGREPSSARAGVAAKRSRVRVGLGWGDGGTGLKLEPDTGPVAGRGARPQVFA